MTARASAGDEAGAQRADAWPLSLSYYTVAELDCVEAVRVAADCGFAHIGLRLLNGQPGGSDGSETALMTDRSLRRALSRALRDSGVTALDANTARLTPETEVEAFHPFLDVAAALGAKHVLTTLDDAVAARAGDSFARLCEAARSRGLTVDLEFVPWLGVSSLERAAELVRSCDDPAAGIAVDALHFHRSGSSLAALRGMPRAWFRYLQICDAPEGEAAPSGAALIHEAVEERLLPGEGVIDLGGLVAALPRGLPLALEIPQARLAETLPARERVGRAVKATRSLLAGI